MKFPLKSPFLHLANILILSKATKVDKFTGYYNTPETRKILADYAKNSLDHLALGRFKEHFFWLDQYGHTIGYPHKEKLLLEMATVDEKVIETIELFYEKVSKETDKLPLLKSVLGDRTADELAGYLLDSGFSPDGYSLMELLSMVLRIGKLRGGPLDTDPKMQELISANLVAVSLLSNFNCAKLAQALIARDQLPVELISDMLLMGIQDLEAFSKLSVMRNDRTRSSLFPVFRDSRSFSRMPNTFKTFSKYPEAIECLSLVQEPDKVEKQILTILFPRHAFLGRCDRILNFNLPAIAGGWRATNYEGFNYLNFWPHALYIVENFAHHETFKERMVVDYLWVKICKLDDNLAELFKEKRPQFIRLILGEMSKKEIRLMLQMYLSMTFTVKKGDLRDDRIVWDYFLQFFPPNEPTDDDDSFAQLFRFYLIPNLFPDSISEIVLSTCLEWQDSAQYQLYIDGLLQEYIRSNGPSSIKNGAINYFSELFEVAIDDAMLDEIECDDLREFYIMVYQRIRSSIIQTIKLPKLLGLFHDKYAIKISKWILLREVLLKLIQNYSKNDFQSFLIQKTFRVSLNSFSTIDLCNGIKDDKDVPPCLNELYYTIINPVTQLSHWIYGYFGTTFFDCIVRSKLNLLCNSEGFGLDFLHDLQTASQIFYPDD